MTLVSSQGSKSSYKLKAVALESSLVFTRAALALKESALSKSLGVNKVLRDSLAAIEEEINDLREAFLRFGSYSHTMSTSMVAQEVQTTSVSIIYHSTPTVTFASTSTSRATKVQEEEVMEEAWEEDQEEEELDDGFFNISSQWSSQSDLSSDDDEDVYYIPPPLDSVIMRSQQKQGEVAG